MSARVFLFIMSLLRLAYSGTLTFLMVQHHKLPLPEVIADIYDEERYKKFLAYDAETDKLSYCKKAIYLLIDTCILFSPVFSAIEQISGGNPYITVLLTILLYEIFEGIVGFVYRYLYTFKIDEKYGLNKKTFKVFVKDWLMGEVEGILLLVGFMLMFAFFGEHLPAWTNHFQVGWVKVIVLCVLLWAVMTLFSTGFSVLSLFLLKKKYTFTPLPEGELRSKIEKMLEGAKKVKEIYVYDESKKSVAKNAFLLRFYWYREISIADNFLEENSERELLAVLSHEIGHLKYKKKFRDYGLKIFFLVLYAAIAYLMHDPSALFSVNAWVRESFHISTNNYYVFFSIYAGLIKPIMALNSIYSHYLSRCKEDEADMEAVKNGLGEELISTFKAMSSDELIDIYPHPLVELLEATHPGMYHRISTIHAGIEKMKSASA